MNITIQDCEHFLSCNFDEYEEVIIGENLEIPFLNKDGITTNTGFETSTEFPVNYRKIYLHPSLYYKETFSEEYRGQIYNLYLHVKRGHQVRFLYSDLNLALLCCIMAEIFKDCRGGHRDYVDYTNVPFPYKRSDSDNTWIWACNWGKDFPERIETKEDVSEFRNYVRLSFPTYNTENFPVDVLETEKEGVTGFSVHPSKGLLTVIAGSPQENILVTIENFPSGILNDKRLDRKNEMTVNLSMSQERRSWTGTLTITQLLRFLLIYRASKQYQGLVYDREKNGNANMFYQTDTGLKEMPYNGLFLTKQGKDDPNFTATLDKLIKPLTDKVTKGNILKLTKKGSRYSSPQNATLLCECYQHLTVSFSSSALEDFNRLRLGDVTAHHNIKSLSEHLEQYKKDILEATER